MKTTYVFAVCAWLTDQSAVLRALRREIEEHIEKQEIHTGVVTVDLIGPREDVGG